MRSVWLCLLLVLAGCPQVENLNVNLRAESPDAGQAGAAGAAGAGPVAASSKFARVASEDAGELAGADADAGVDADGGEDTQAPADPIAAPEPDFDHDGIPDRLDVCPTDSPNDTDHDGKCDSQDPCPLDPFDDRDGDGICDSQDPCPTGPDSDHDGVCDFEDQCPFDANNDTDGDGKCDSADPCPTDALDDSDGDGSCDSVDKCAGSDDRLDSDHDGVPDGCDRCPSRSDDDTDANGYPDACDQVLWRLENSGTFSYPIARLRAELLLYRADGTYLQAVIPLEPSVIDETLPTTSVISTEWSTTTNYGTVVYHQGTATYDEFVSALRQSTSRGRANCGFQQPTFSSDHWGSQWMANDAVSPISSAAHIERITVVGEVSLPSGAHAFSWEVRGY